MAEENYREKLKDLLGKLFQFDSADLDFGIYRIMNQKRSQIERFIEDDLVDAVEAELGEYTDSKQAGIRDEVEAIKAEIIENLGEEALDENETIKQIYISTPIARKLKERYDRAREALKHADMPAQQQAEIFSHIYHFFSRYYDNGDFMSLRRYSQREKYAIPYNGEEVVLHWANKDQYYIKTGEYFKNYSFRLGDYTVDFRILEAEGTTNNNKSGSRFFVQAQEEPQYDAGNRHLTIFFEYRGLNTDEEKKYGTKNVQDGIISAMNDVILSQVQEAGLKGALNRMVDDENRRTVLEKHLRAYTKKNTADYFIHKDLKGFLTRELDFYIKNEVFRLDDLGTEHEVGVEQYVSRVRVMKSICLKVIDFLAQIEDFQKMLFEKKKFVVSTDYCMTLDHVPEELYAEIVGNEAQISEWRFLYSIGEEKQTTITSFVSKSINKEYLKEHPYLMLDTKFFDQSFKDKLLALFDELDEAILGLMINSENWQAQNLLYDKYKKSIKCIYIDPPYNTGNDEFIYKDNYQHSSWITMMYDRLNLAKEILDEEGVIFISIDKREQACLKIICDILFGVEGFISDIAMINNLKGRSDDKYIATAHENVLIYKKSKFETYGVPIPEEYLEEYSRISADGRRYRLQGLRKRGSGSRKEDRPNMFYPFYYNEELNKLSLERQSNEDIEILPKLSTGHDGRWRWGKDTAIQRMDELSVQLVTGRSEFDIFQIDYLEVGGNLKTIKPKSFWLDKSFSSDAGTKQYKNLMGNIEYPNPKSPNFISYCLTQATAKNEIILDFFAGSGTTAQAVLNLNKENSENRKYILVEMGNYFASVTKPRVQKVVFSNKWKEGKPQSTDGISHIFKYQTLEQYEDTLNNIEFTEAGTVQRTLADMDGYFLRYMLDFETRDSSPCRFNVTKLEHPFSYTLKITEGNELKTQTVELVETFNYLLGLHVRKIRTFNNSGTYYRVVVGTKDEADIAVIWRDTEGIDLKADKTFIEETILSEFKPSKTYINADFYVEGAYPIEPEFRKLMVG